MRNIHVYQSSNKLSTGFWQKETLLTKLTKIKVMIPFRGAVHNIHVGRSHAPEGGSGLRKCDKGGG